MEIGEIIKLKEELTLLSIKTDDNEYALTILTTLLSSWNLFISFIGAKVPKPSDIIGQILLEDFCCKECSKANTMLIITKKHFFKPKFQKGIFCYGCGKEGHIWPKSNNPICYTNHDSKPLS